VLVILLLLVGRLADRLCFWISFSFVFPYAGFAFSKSDFVGIKKAGDDCYSTARETSGLCSITIEKAHEMVSFGRDLQATLEDVTGGGERSLDASKFAIILDLVDGDKIKDATKLARDLSGLSLECVNKSREMMVAMEKGIDALVSSV
jgi:hypothetical protein